MGQRAEQMSFAALPLPCHSPPSSLCVLCDSVVQFLWWDLLHFLDLDVAELDDRPFRLEADRAFRQVALARADLRAIDLRRDGAVRRAGDLGRVPLADGLGRLVLGGLIVLRVADLLAAEEVQEAVIGV